MDLQQTNFTMLWGVVDPDLKDLLTLVGNTRDLSALPDEQIDEIMTALCVNSYSEFERKFPLKAYGFFDAENQKMHFQLNRPEHLPPEFVTEYPLDRNSPTIGVLFDMIAARSRQGARTVEFDFESLTKQLSPEKMRASIQQIRKEMNYNYGKYAALPEEDPVRDDLAHKLNALFADAREHYNNPVQMLALAADDCEQRLLLSGAGDGDAKGARITAGLLALKEDGSLEAKALPPANETALAAMDDAGSAQLAKVLSEDYESNAGDYASPYVKDLVVRTFSPLATTVGSKVDYQREVENHNAYLSLYTQAQKDFMECVKPVCEILLGVHLFFEQYEDTVKSKSAMRPRLLVANCDPEMAARSGNLPRVQTFLNTTNLTNDMDNHIWQAIFPNLSFSKAGDQKEIRQVFATAKQKKKTDVYSMETLSTLTDALADYGIKTFFSFETGEDTTFDKVAKEGIGAFIDRCAPLMNKDYSACAVPCLPNVTVIPKNKSGVITGKLMTTDGENAAYSDRQEDVQRFYLNGIYIPAAFIAAGIMAACQDPDFLREKFIRSVDPTLPGVRFDIESGDNALLVPTTLAREVAGWTRSVKEEINRQGFGFILSSEVQSLKGKPVNNLTVYKARSLAHDGYQYEPIFQQTVSSYFECVLRRVSSDFKKDAVEFFFSANPSSQMQQWMNRKDFINAVIKPEDAVTYDLDERAGHCEIHFQFGGVQKNVKVRLRRTTAGAGV